MIRVLTLGEQPMRYLEAYEQALCRLGFRKGEIEDAAAVIAEVIRGLETGRLRVTPDFIRQDKSRPGSSFYFFVDDVVEGVYSASPFAAHLEYLAFTFDDGMDASEAIARIEMEAARHAAA